MLFEESGPVDVTRIALGPAVEGTTGRGARMGVGQIEMDGMVYERVLRTRQ